MSLRHFIFLLLLVIATSATSRPSNLQSGDMPAENERLTHAIEAGDENSVLHLIESGASTNSAGLSPLACAVANRKLEIAKLLLGRGANVDSKDMSGCSSVFWAAYNNDVGMLKLLISRGANLESRGNPLLVAIYNRYDEVAQLLVEAGADVNAQDPSGDSALHYAVKRGSIPMAVLIRKAGGDIDKKNTSGKSPLDYAGSKMKDAMLSTAVEAGKIRGQHRGVYEGSQTTQPSTQKGMN